MNPDEKRASKRIPIEVPVYIGREKSITRDVSWDGIYFLTNRLFTEGGNLDFSLDLAYALPGKPVKLGCQGKVIRVEQHDGKFGIAVKINNLQYIH